MITAIQDRLDLSRDELKSYLKIDISNTNEDAELDTILNAAKSIADEYCQNEFITVDEETEVTTENPIPGALKVAVLRIAAALYEQRADHKAGENVNGVSYTAGQIEWNAQRIMFPYRKFFAV
jgi:hypothetical protein